MRMRCWLTVLALGLAQSASAQSVFNPNPQIYSPFARPTLSPYLNIVGGAGSNYYNLTLREFDFRNQLFRPILVAPDGLPGLDPSRTPGQQAIVGFQQSANEAMVDRWIRDTRLSPTGHPTGFLMPSPYFRLPNQRSFIPYQPTTPGAMRP